jgi:hypothetical protein
MKSFASAAVATATISASVAPGRPNVTLSLTVPWNT